MQADDLKAQVAAVLGEDPAAGVCLQLFNELAGLPCDRGLMLTYTSMQKMVHRAEIDYPLIAAVSFLTSSKCAILKAHGHFVDDNGEEYELEDADFQRLLITGKLIHPRTGEEIFRPRDKVTPVFSLTDNKAGTRSE